MGKQHIIELNGQRYDAATGKKITDTPATPRSAATNGHRRRNIDGFAPPTDQASSKQTMIARRKAEKSRTLMRTLVNKPAPVKPIPSTAVVPKKSVTVEAAKTISPSRLAHAQAVAKNALVRHFNTDISPGRTAAVAPTKPSVRPPRPATVATAEVKANPLSVGLAQAKSHEQAKLKKPRRHVRLARRLHISPRILSGGALVLAGLLIGGFFAYQNLPNLTMRLASTRSGVHGSLPGYTPAGFALNDTISYRPGQITVTYVSNSDRRNFHIIQAATTWNSQTLFSDYVAKAHPNNQVVYPKGKTVYLYDHDATWVDGGIWYRIEGESELNSDQLQSIANSL